MKLEEGMYVRTKKGIGRITEYTKHESWGYIVKVLGQYSCYAHTSNGELSDVIKASHNLIDLIEVGDYVNNMRVVAKDSDNRLYIPEDLGQPYDREFSNGCFEYTLLDNKFEIKSIVTKEQFNSVKYEVE